MDERAPEADKPPSQLIDERITELGDWRGEMLALLRNVIKDADPEVIEEWKWRGVPVWYHDGMLVTGETYKSVVKMTFAKGASLEDPAGLFNSSLEGNTRRAIDFREGEKVDKLALQALVRAAVALSTPTTCGRRSSHSCSTTWMSITSRPRPSRRWHWPTAPIGPTAKPVSG